MDAAEPYAAQLKEAAEAGSGQVSLRGLGGVRTARPLSQPDLERDRFALTPARYRLLRPLACAVGTFKVTERAVPLTPARGRGPRPQDVARLAGCPKRIHVEVPSEKRGEAGIHHMLSRPPVRIASASMTRRKSTRDATCESTRRSRSRRAATDASRRSQDYRDLPTATCRSPPEAADSGRTSQESPTSTPTSPNRTPSTEWGAAPAAVLRRMRLDVPHSDSHLRGG